MSTPIQCERCKEPCEAFAVAGGGCAIVDRAPHGLGMFALAGRLLITIVPENVPAVDGETIHESTLGGLRRFRAHEDSCTKVTRSKRPPAPVRTVKTPIRQRRTR